MRYGRIVGGCSLLLAFQTVLACDDSEDWLPDQGKGGTSAGSGGSSTAGTGASPTDGGDAGADTGGSGGSAGSDGATAGSGGSGGATGGSAGSAGTAGTGGTPMCTNDTQCADTNPCTDDTCTNGTCAHTNNTATCDDNNFCTSDDKCAAGVCAGTNNTLACDDLSSCTTGEACLNGACVGGTKDTTLCPVCVDAANIIQNCDFTDGANHWETVNAWFEGGNGTMSVTNERLVVEIANGGTYIYSVQPRQEPLTIEQGRLYTLKIVAGASVERTMMMALTQATGRYIVYSNPDNPGGGYTVNLEKQMKPFSFDFLMTAATDANVKLELKLGGPGTSDTKVFMDDIAVLKRNCTDASQCSDGNVCTDDACDTNTGLCVWTNNTAACDADDNDCTNDVCGGGECTHPPVADGATCAADTDNCTEDTCEAGACTHYFDNNVCQCTTQANCDDRDVCTDDSCGGGGACEYVNNTAPCQDTDRCTVDDVCGSGSCTAGTNVCFDCTGNGNLLTNCNFSASATEATGWAEGFFGATGSQKVDGGQLAVTIDMPGTDAYMVQPRQEGLVLTQGTTYVVRMNAMASIARPIIVSLTENGGAYTSYSGEQTLNLTTKMQVLEFEFTMNAAPPADKVKLEFRLGGAANNPTLPNTVWIDNVVVAPKP